MSAGKPPQNVPLRNCHKELLVYLIFPFGGLRRRSFARNCRKLCQFSMAAAPVPPTVLVVRAELVNAPSDRLGLFCRKFEGQLLGSTYCVRSDVSSSALRAFV
jgi:hypothetical protein